MLAVTKKVPWSGWGVTGQPGSEISYRIILLTAYILNCNFPFITNPAMQPISLIKARVRCGVGLGVGIFFSIV